jgi:SAM-dependent methyltransferase
MAESFGVDAQRYDRARPAYPDELVDRIMTAAPGARVLDVGCGTGIAARQFQAAGAAVLGVEPDARMAAFARDSGVDVEVARFEEWPDGGRTFDAVVAGTAWHWVDPAAGPAKAAQVLRTGGLLAVFGHAFHLPPHIAEATAAAYERVAPGAPVGFRMPAADVYERMYAGFADGIRTAGGFGEPEQWRFSWERTYTRQEWLDQLPTTGAMTQLPPDAVAEILDATGDATGEAFVLPYTTLAVAAVRA